MSTEELIERVEQLRLRKKDRLSEEGNANSRQEGGNHYKFKLIQPWDYIASNQLGFFEGNIIKYITRHREKDGLQDLRKARHYLDKLIEIEEANRK